MKIVKINSCMDCPKYVDDEVGWCEITRAVAPLEGLPMWCPLEEVRSANNWVNIKDQLPPQYERVLVWLWEKGEIDIDILRREGKSDGGGLQFIRNYLHNITFWTPLPAPPDTINEEIDKLKAKEASDMEEAIKIRHDGEKLWDGVTDFLDESSIKKIERLYKNELSWFI